MGMLMALLHMIAVATSDKAAPVGDAPSPPVLPAAPEVLTGSAAESERPSTAVHNHHVQEHYTAGTLAP